MLWLYLAPVETVITVVEVVVVTAVVEEAIKMLHLIKRFFLAVLMLVISTVSSLKVFAADKDIVILYTNDIHCAIDDNQGLAALSQYKKDMLAHLQIAYLTAPYHRYKIRVYIICLILRKRGHYKNKHYYQK